MVNKLDKWFYKGTFYLSAKCRKGIRFSHSVYWYFLSIQNSSMVECSTCNADVVGSSPASGFAVSRWISRVKCMATFMPKTAV